MNYSRFKRRYIMMEAPNPAYSLGTGLKGLSKFETGGNKGLLRIGIQNLAEKKETEYSVLLAGQENGVFFTVKMGTLIADNPGCYSYLGSFNPCDVDGKCHGLHDFHSVLITADTVDGKKTMVMRGHLQSKAYPITYEMLNPDPFSDYMKTYCRHMEESLSQFEETWPFGEDFNAYRWWRIDNVSGFPFTESGKHAGCNLQVCKYNHYLFGSYAYVEGITPDFWLLGIPGKRSEGEHLSGDFLWVPLLGVPLDSDGYGYHLCAIAAQTGKLLSPGLI